MSFIAIGVGVAGAAISITTTMINNKSEKKAAREAQKQAVKDANIRDYQARKAEQFAQTEGQGVGTTGEINMQVDNQVGDGTIKDTLELTL